MSMEEFRTWTAVHHWNISRSGDAEAVKLSYQIQIVLHKHFEAESLRKSRDLRAIYEYLSAVPHAATTTNGGTGQ